MKRTILLGVTMVAFAAAIWFAWRGSDNSSDSGPAKNAQGPGLAPTSDGTRARPNSRQPAAQPRDKWEPESEVDNTEELEERFRPIVEALRRAQERARQHEQDATTGQAEEGQQGETEAKIWGVDRDGIQGAVRSIIPEVRECYEAWVSLNPSLEGKLIVAFAIQTSEDGDDVATVVDAKVKEGGVGNQFLDGCVVASLGSLQFDVPADGGVMNVTYPFTFRAKDNQEPNE